MIDVFVHLYPRDAAVPVRDPAIGDHLPAQGRSVAISTYWRRRLADGDVTTQAPAIAAENAPGDPPATESPPADPPAPPARRRAKKG